MKRPNFPRLLSTLAIQGGVQLVMIALVIGAAFAAFGESGLYSEQALVETTSPPLPTDQPVATSTSETEQQPTSTEMVTNTIAPSKTEQSATATVKPAPTKTWTQTKTATLLTPTDDDASATEEVCGPPDGWVLYTIQSGDNLYRISLKFRTTISALKAANCMGNSTVIVVGEQLWVPNVATSTPVASYTPTAGKTKPVTSTKTPVPQTATPTNTVEPTLEPSPTTGITQTKSSP